jgi:hypothetical protein
VTRGFSNSLSLRLRPRLRQALIYVYSSCTSTVRTIETDDRAVFVVPDRHWTALTDEIVYS